MTLTHPFQLYDLAQQRQAALRNEAERNRRARAALGAGDRHAAGTTVAGDPATAGAPAWPTRLARALALWL